jgi:hypothetical protein
VATYQALAKLSPVTTTPTFCRAISLVRTVESVSNPNVELGRVYVASLYLP